MLNNMRNSCLIFRGVRNPIENTLLSSSLEMTHTRAPLFYVAEYIPWIQYPQSFLLLLFHMLTISIYPYFSSFHFYFNGIVLFFPNRYIHLWEWNRNSIFIQCIFHLLQQTPPHRPVIFCFYPYANAHIYGTIPRSDTKISTGSSFITAVSVFTTPSSTALTFDKSDA